MTRATFTCIALLLFALPALRAEPLNVIVVLVDDLGWKDLG